MEKIILCGECNINDNVLIKNTIINSDDNGITINNKKLKTTKCEHNITKQICKECNPKAFCEHGKLKKICKECGGYDICEHGKRKYVCKECGGSRICTHGKIKRQCKDCGGSVICIHGKQKYQCKECGGFRICEHNKFKHACKECGGNQICEHNKFKHSCKECFPSNVCKHNKLKRNCKDCDGSNICEHNKLKRNCKDCDGSNICDHKKFKYDCKVCTPLLYCEHDKLKKNCKNCRGSNICAHGKQKTCCKECDGGRLCKSCWCEKYANKKYDEYCLFCYVNLFPDKQITRNYKTKEKDVVDRILNLFPNFTWVSDKKIQDGCSKRRPDLLLDMGSHIIIVEIDENAHTDYDCSCENKRLMEISQDLGHRPIVFIRFNPDDYMDKDGNKIKSCWKLNRTTGLVVLDSEKIKEWEERFKLLSEQINYWVKNPTEKTVEIVELFY